MADTRHLKSHFGRKLKKMSKVTAKTGYETGLTICGDKNDGTEHTKQPIIGEKGEVSGTSCTLGTGERVRIHTHNKHAPSKQDLKVLSQEENDHCLIINGVEAAQGEINEDDDTAMMLCMEGDGFNPEDANKLWSDGERVIEENDVKILEDAGIDTDIENL